MLYSTSELIKYKISGVDGEIGKITDFYFDDREWTIRYAVVDTNSWLPGGKVLLSSHVFNKLDTENEKFHVDLTREQIKNSPDIDADEPVSREKQELLHGYYNWPLYWGPTQYNLVSNGAPAVMYPIRTIQSAEIPSIETPTTEVTNTGIANADRSNEVDSHLRSFKELESYHIITSTGEIGKSLDFIVQQGSWMVWYMVMDTAKFFSSKKILIPVEWIKWVSWYQQKVSIWPTKENLESCPSFEQEYPINTKHEADLHKYYDSAKKW